MPFDSIEGTSVPVTGGKARLSGSTDGLLVEGIRDQAYDLRGRYVVVENSSNVDVGTESFSIAVWVKPDAAHEQTILEKRSIDAQFQYTGYLLIINRDVLTFQLALGPVTPQNFAFGKINNCLWHFVVVSADRGPAGHIRLYIDGKWVGDWPNPAPDISLSNPAPLLIGKHINRDYPLNGPIDELVITKSIIPADEIQRYYEAVSPTIPHSDTC